jgi:hypothetical protein
LEFSFNYTDHRFVWGIQLKMYGVSFLQMKKLSRMASNILWWIPQHSSFSNITRNNTTITPTNIGLTSQVDEWMQQRKKKADNMRCITLFVTLWNSNRTPVLIIATGTIYEANIFHIMNFDKIATKIIL